jgi:hypothetical protein
VSRFLASPLSTVWCKLASDGGSGGFRGPAQRVCRTLGMERPGTSGSLCGQIILRDSLVDGSKLSFVGY